jgi:signal transduction histidine kinase
VGWEFKLLRKDGDWRWFVAHSSVVRDENGAVVEEIGVAHDVTEMRGMMEELERANQHLKNTQTQLVQSEKMASLGTLVAGIAHEINTPVGAIHSMHDTLVRAVRKMEKALKPILTLDSADVKELPALLNTIKQANKVIDSGTDRVTNIVRRLRSFARLDEAELKLADIHEGIEDTLTLLHHEIKHGIEVNRRYGRIPPFPHFPGQLNQVFLNLFINAKQAMGTTGTLTITTEHKGDQVRISIEDTGTGIPREDLDKIFDPGFTTKGVGIGTGLGLSICYQIIQKHHGEIKVKSEVGKGTRFTILIPMNLDERMEKTDRG